MYKVCQASHGTGSCALGLSLHLKKTIFFANLLVISDVLVILGNLSRSFWTNALNLLTVKDLLRDSKAALEALYENPLCGGYAMGFSKLLTSLSITETLDEDSFVTQMQSYIRKIVNNLNHRCPQPHLMSLFGLLDPRNVSHATPGAVMDLAEHFKLDGTSLWTEFIVYQSFAKNLSIPKGQTAIKAAAQAILQPINKDAMSASFPIMSDLLARLVVLPSSSAEVERVFSSMKRIKIAQHNRLNTTTLDHLIRVSMEGNKVVEWEPLSALRLWGSWENRRFEKSVIQQFEKSDS